MDAISGSSSSTSRRTTAKPAGEEDEQIRKLRVNTPFPAHGSSSGEHKESLYWGTYRPHVYFGVRARSSALQDTTIFNCWIGVKDGKHSIRHVYQDSKLLQNGWTHHNGRDYGHQVVVDQDVTLLTSFIKSKGVGSGYGGDWAVRIDVQKEELDEDIWGTGHLFFYLADEEGNSLKIGREKLDTCNDSLFASGSRKDVGDWELHLVSEDKSGDEYVPYWPAELYTAVPSRSFFPRGFLWDEGFHQLLIWRWDICICLDIVGHWLDLMNIDGWIPRKHFLGAEALSKIPEDIVPHNPTNANPPTLFLVIHDLVCSAKRNTCTATESKEISSFLNRAFDRLEAWFQWFNTTQAGKDASSYYWHGRDKEILELNPQTLTSGLDDYPRASHPTEDERHLDLRCWMLLAADCMHSISDLLERNDNLGKEYKSTTELLSNMEILNQMHFDDVYGAYYDFGNHTEKIRLHWQELRTPDGSYAGRELVREVSEKPKLRLVPHIGYVSLFPLIMRIIPSPGDVYILITSYRTPGS